MIDDGNRGPMPGAVTHSDLAAIDRDLRRLQLTGWAEQLDEERGEIVVCACGVRTWMPDRLRADYDEKHALCRRRSR